MIEVAGLQSAREMSLSNDGGGAFKYSISPRSVVALLGRAVFGPVALEDVALELADDSVVIRASR